MTQPDDAKAAKPTNTASMARQDRLAKALRANLRRRKAAGQAQADAATGDPAPDEES
jgi:hypothetical protein